MKSNHFLNHLDGDIISDQFSFKKWSPNNVTQSRKNVIVLNNLKDKVNKKKKYLSYLRIDIRNLKTDDSSSLLISEEFMKKTEKQQIPTNR
jgi:hypothetical protein